MSGFIRPSAVGPLLEKSATKPGPISLAASEDPHESCAPTVSTFFAVPGYPTVLGTSKFFCFFFFCRGSQLQR